MAFNAFIKFDGIKGEVLEKDHKDWVAATKVTFNISQPASFTRQATSGGTAEAVEFSPLTIEKLIDMASPKLLEAASKGKSLKEVTIDYQKAGGDKPIKYLEIKLSDVIISGINHSGDPKGDYQYPVEQISMTYGKIVQTYTQQKPDGSAGGNVSYGHDVTTGAAA
jgi:type VI secretion system secreted protein Hcp